MVNLFLLFLFCLQGVYASFFYASSLVFDKIEGRSKPYVPTIALLEGSHGKIGLTLPQDEQVGMFFNGTEGNLNKAVNGFAQITMNLKGKKIHENRFGFGSNSCTISCEQRVDDGQTSFLSSAVEYNGVSPENLEENFPRIEFSNNEKKGNAIFIERTNKGNESYANKMTLLAAFMAVLWNQEHNVRVLLGSQVAKNEFFNKLLNQAPRGIALKVEYEDEHLTPCFKFEQEDFKKYAEVVIGLDNVQTLNIYTLVHALIFFAHGTGFKLPTAEEVINALNPGGSAISKQEEKSGENQIINLEDNQEIFLESSTRGKIHEDRNNNRDSQEISSDDEDEQILSAVDIKKPQNHFHITYQKPGLQVEEPTGESPENSLDFLGVINQLCSLHQELVNKGLASRIIIEKLFETVATEKYQDKEGVAAVKKLFEDAKKAVNGAAIKEKQKIEQSVNVFEGHIPQQKSWWQKLPSWPLSYAFYGFGICFILQRLDTFVKAYRS